MSETQHYKTAADCPDEAKVAEETYAEIEAMAEAARVAAGLYLAHYERARRVAAGFPRLVRNGYVAPVSVSWREDSLKGILLKCEDVSDLRSVTPLLKALVTEGYKILGEPEDYAELRRRHWSLCWREDEKRKVVVNVMAFLPWREEDQGQRCRVVEVPGMVHKIVCGEEEEAAAQTA